MPKLTPREELRSFLSIDKDALDECLMEQPELYAKVAEAVVLAEAERDTCQLDYDELMAGLDQTVRKEAARREERLTDAAIKQRLPTMPTLQKLGRDLLDKKREAKLWRALEKAFEERAKMLTKLVDLHLRQTYGYALEAGASQSRTALVGAAAESNRRLASAARRQKVLP